MARHGDGIPQLLTGAHQEKSGLASERGRENRVGHGPGYVLGVGAPRLRSDRARLGKTFLGSAILPVMLRVLMSWLADRLEGGERLMGIQGAMPLVFYTDAKAEDGRAWIGMSGALVLATIREGLAPWAFVKGHTKKVIAPLELLATLIGVRLWVSEGQSKQTTRVAIKGYTNNQSNESLC